MARLLEHGSESFRALDLQTHRQAALPDAATSGSMAPGKVETHESGLSGRRRRHQQTMDQRTRDEIEARAKELAAAQARADEAGDVRRSEEIADEISDIAQLWKKGVGLRGRS